MTETSNLTVQQKTVSLPSTTSSSSATALPDERSSSDVYQLYNDTDMHVSVCRQEWDVPKGLFVLAPGATSDSYPAGHDIYILYVESGASTPITWDGWDSITYYYHQAGYTHGGMNNVSSVSGG